MKIKVFLIIALAVCLSSSPALADTMVTSGVWAPVPAPSGAIPPFWDNPSLDGGNVNAGYILTGTNTAITGYTTKDWLGYAGGTAEYLSAKDGLGNATGGVVNDVYFNNNVGGQSAYLIVEISSYETINEFGVYDRAAPANKTVIFAGGATDGATWSGGVPIAYTSYGFYLINGDIPKKTFYSDTTNVTNPDSDSNFAFFRNTTEVDTFYIAMEDLKSPITTEGIGDFNDMIIKARVVPLPGAFLLLGAGLARLAAYARRRKD